MLGIMLNITMVTIIFEYGPVGDFDRTAYSWEEFFENIGVGLAGAILTIPPMLIIILAF